MSLRKQHANITRRGLIAGGAVILLSGCGKNRKGPLPAAGPSLIPGDSHPLSTPSQTQPSPVSSNTPEAVTPSGPVPTKATHTVNAGANAIALTFDDGPNPPYTQEILAVLKRNNVKATFFMIGQSAAAHPDLVRAVVAGGHHLGNHSWNHPNLARLSPALVAQQLERANNAITKASGGVRPTFFRAPYGNWSSAVFETCHRLGLQPVDWSVDPRDWARPGAYNILTNVLDNVTTGSIILDHDGGGDRSQTVAALTSYLPRLIAQGYHFTTP